MFHCVNWRHSSVPCGSDYKPKYCTRVSLNLTRGQPNYYRVHVVRVSGWSAATYSSTSTVFGRSLCGRVRLYESPRVLSLRRRQSRGYQSQPIKFSDFFVALSRPDRSELDAARAYNKAARSLHGAAAKLNLLPDEAPATASTSALAPKAPLQTALEEKEKSPRLAAAATAPAPPPAPEAARSLAAGRSSHAPLGSAVEAHANEESRGGAGAAADLYYPAELDFRDLEEIPETTGPPLWDNDPKLESAWAARPEPAGAGDGSSSAASVDVDGKRRSVGTSTMAQAESGRGSLSESLFVEDAGPIEEDGEGRVDGGVLRLGEGDGALPKDDGISAYPRPDPVAPATAKKTSRAAAAVAGMASVGGEAVEAVGGGRRQQRLSSSLASSQADAATGMATAAAAPRPPAGTTAASPGTAAPAVGAEPSGLHPPLPPTPTPPPLAEAEQARSESVSVAVAPAEAAGTATAATAAATDAETVLVPGKGKLASIEPPLSTRSVQDVAANAASEGAGSGESRHQGSGQIGSTGGDGDGRGGEDWGIKGALPGVAGAEWERDEAGDELYAERLNSVVDVRCSAVVFRFLVWMAWLLLHEVTVGNTVGKLSAPPFPADQQGEFQGTGIGKSLGMDAIGGQPRSEHGVQLFMNTRGGANVSLVRLGVALHLELNVPSVVECQGKRESVEPPFSARLSDTQAADWLNTPPYGCSFTYPQTFLPDRKLPTNKR